MARLFGPEKKDSSESSWLSESENLRSEPAAYLNLQLGTLLCLPGEGGAGETGPVFERHLPSVSQLPVSSLSLVSCRDQSPARTGAQRPHLNTSHSREKAQLLY